MSKASEYAKAWAEVRRRAVTERPNGIALYSGRPGELPLAIVTRTGNLLMGPNDVSASDIPALIAWLTDTFTDGGT